MAADSSLKSLCRSTKPDRSGISGGYRRAVRPRQDATQPAPSQAHRYEYSPRLNACIKRAALTPICPFSGVSDPRPGSTGKRGQHETKQALSSLHASHHEHAGALQRGVGTVQSSQVARKRNEAAQRAEVIRRCPTEQYSQKDRRNHASDP